MSPLLDESTDFGARAARRLRTEANIWLTTVSPSGAPSPNPVWFLWDGDRSVLTYNLPASARVAHVAANPRVTLHLNTDPDGGNVVVLRGTAQLLPDLAETGVAAYAPEYVEKYAAAMVPLGETPESFARTYSRPVVVTLTGVRGF